MNAVFFGEFEYGIVESIMVNVLKSFGWAINGLVTVWREERNFRIQVILGLLVVGFGFYFHLSLLEWIVIVGCIAAVLSAEIINTAVEDLCNKVEPNTDPVIGKIKDVMAGFVFTVCVAVVIIASIIGYAHYAAY